MNNKLTQILRTAWTEPRCFSVCLAALSTGTFAAVLAGTTDPSRPSGLVAYIVSGSLLCCLVSIPIFILAWIPPVQRLFSRLLQRKVLALGGVATLIVIYYAVENRRGGQAWQRYRHAAEAHGEQFDFSSFVPPTVPDEQNFFETPLWTDLRFVLTNGTVVWKDTNWGNRVLFDLFGANYKTPGPGAWLKAGRVELQAWQAFYRSNKLAAAKGSLPTNYVPIAREAKTPAADVLLALSGFNENRQMLVESCIRPQSRFWDCYEPGIQIPGPQMVLLGRLKRCFPYFSLHACAALKAGDKNAALDDVRVLFRLLEATRGEPNMIYPLVSAAVLPLALQPVWEGMVDRQWSEADLSFIEGELGKLDFIADYHFTMRASRARELREVDYIREAGLAPVEDLAGLTRLDAVLPAARRHSAWETIKKCWRRAILLSAAANQRVRPAGRLEGSKIDICRTYDYLLSLVDRQNRVISPAAVETSDAALARQRGLPKNISLKSIQPRARCAQKCALGQTYVDLARAACALERFRLAKTEFPEELDALAPGFIDKLPRDVINGQPLKYRRTQEGQFVVYSVGWNGADDNGKPELRKSGSVDENGGDWVWRYPEQ
jgi:hypothetical protein